MTVPAFTELYRLEKIVAECFPDGSVTVAALRREIQKGRLDAWRLAGKDMTTKDAVARMLEKCRVKPARRASGTESQDEPKPEGAPKKASGSSSTPIG